MMAQALRVLRRTPLHAVVIGMCLIWLIPAIGLLVSSFRPPRLVAATGWWTAFIPPLQFTLDNYRQVLGAYNMGRSFMNSLFISLPATVIPIMVAAYAAYAFAWMRFPGREILFTIVVGSLVIPLQMTLIPVLRLFTSLDLVGTYPAIWMAHTGYGLPFAIYLLRNFIGALPKDLLEAAAIDGADPLTVAPMTVTVSNLVNSLGQNWQLLTAAAFISMSVPLVVFFTLQRYFVRGILAGAVKG